MKNRKKKIIRISGILIILICSIVTLFVLSKTKEPPKEASIEKIYNQNKSFIQKKEYQELIFDNIECSYDGKNSMLSYDIINQTNETIHLQGYNIDILDKNNNILTSIVLNLEEDIEAGKTRRINNEININITNATQMVIKDYNAEGEVNNEKEG